MTDETSQKAAQDWVKAAQARDGHTLLSLLSTTVTLLPPFQEDEVHGAGNVLTTFAAFDGVVEKFEYGRTWSAEHTAILEFTATINGQPIHGVDMISLDRAGKIERFDILVRPATGAEALGRAVKQHLANEA